MFDETDDRHADTRQRVRGLLGDETAWERARRSVLNAHYTSAEVVSAIWGAVRALGFEGGAVLEPGCGSGNFIGFAPEGAQVTGVEMDAATAAVATHLYGHRATIHALRFQDFAAPDGHFDLVIGNVPFAKVTPHDPRHNRGRHSLHNYFILKSLFLTRPGGLVALLTSRYTLDARRVEARSEMAALGDLVSALRLPAGAFAESSGTEVVCDLLILRRRAESDAPALGPAWRDAPLVSLDDGEPVPLNEFFVAHPEYVVGRLGLARGMYGEGELTVVATEALGDALPVRLERLVDAAADRGLTYVPRPSLRAAEPAGRAGVGSEGDGALAPGFAQEGSLHTTPTGGVAQVVNGASVPYRPRVGADLRELRQLIGIRDAARRVLDVQVAGGGDAELAQAQGVLGTRYDEYRRWHGPINRYELARTGRSDPETGEDVLRRVRPRMGGFRVDPDWPLVAALEVFDDESQRARPAPIFSQRVIDPPVARARVDTPPEALAVCLDETGLVTTERVAELLGVDEDAARSALEGLAWSDPVTDELVPAARYLSGNIRAKLAAAAAAAQRDPRFAAHVAALEAVLPRQLEPGEIAARLGAPWIDAEDVEAFCAEVLGTGAQVEHLASLGSWRVALSDGSRASVALSSEWGTGRIDGITLVEACLNQRLVSITDEVEGGKRVRNVEETIAAREKQGAIGDRFAAWVWEDEARAARLAARYNELFASVVVPRYDGSHLSFPGLAATFSPHPHQRDAVARIVTEGRALLAHAVGAGKTAAMIMAAMEMRRLGLVSKPAVVVPNHMLDQFSRDWLQLYPKARVLLADEERLSADRRKTFVARCATGDWDAIVFTHSGFSRLPLGGELVGEYLHQHVERCRAALSASREGKGLSVKRLERRLDQLEALYERLLAAEAKDDGVALEETGIDYLMVDEAHLYKNRRVDSSIDGMGKEGSQRAQDLDAKLWYLRRTRGERIVTFATATPIANSIAEMWVMQSYLQPDVLDALDLAPFDAWAANFGRTVDAVELAPDGASYRLQTRFARFQNVPELLTMYRQVADVRTAEDLGLPVPVLAGGKPEVVVVPRSDALGDYVAGLAERAERIRNRVVDPSEDNMLKVTGDGRKAALDVRLVGLAPDPNGGKVAAAAERIAAIHHETAGLAYVDDVGEPAPRPGAFQLVFCDLSTPAPDRWNVYDELRRALVERGVPRDAVRFVHEAQSNEAKAKLFAACRDGRTASLVGSTEKMGVGTNVQARAVALHHLDCPWRPADIEQREGRILRQGNQNPDVRILRYVTEGSFDIYMWQTVERKATFIAQVTTGKLDDREVDDIGDQALSYAEVKALATGNPLIVEKAGVDAEVAKLVRLQRAHHDDQYRLRRAMTRAEASLVGANDRIDQLTRALDTRVDTHGERFAMTVEGSSYTKRAAAGAALQALGARLLATLAPGDRTDPVEVGELGGFALVAVATNVVEAELRVDLAGTGCDVIFSETDLLHGDASGLVQRLERRVQGLDEALGRARAAAEKAHGEIRRARARIDLPFEHEDRLRQLQGRQRDVNDALLGVDEPAGRDPEPSGAAVPSSGNARPPSPRALSLAARLGRVEASSLDPPSRSL